MPAELREVAVAVDVGVAAGFAPTMDLVGDLGISTPCIHSPVGTDATCGVASSDSLTASCVPITS